MGAILIAGCGYVGCALAARLLARGERVIGVRRNASALPSGIEPLAVDLRDRALADALDPAIDRLVYAASPDGPDEASYRAAYVEGLANVADALERAGAHVTRAVLTSSTAVYAHDDGRWVDEDSPTTAAGNARWLLEAERLLAGRFAEGVALRLGGIYGPGRDRIVRSVADGSARMPRAARHANRIHRDDAASAIGALLEAPAPRRVYVGVDDDPADLREVYAWLAQALGRPPPEPESADAPRARGGNKRCSNARLRALGWAPRYPSFRQGYAAAIAALRR